MSWMQFFTWSIILYGIYYGGNILLDTIKARKSPDQGSTDNVLHFSEDGEAPKTLKAHENIHEMEPEPVLVVNKATAPQEVTNTAATINSAVEGMGVSLKGLFDLARTEAIEFTKPVSFQ